MREDLKPCPFCGSNNLDVSMKTSGKYKQCFQCCVYCKSCRTYGPRVLSERRSKAVAMSPAKIREDDILIDQTIDAWNNRAYSELTDEEIKELEYYNRGEQR